MCDSPELLKALERIEARLDRRRFTDTTCSVDDSQSSLILDYQGYHYLYLWSPTAITLKLNDLGTVAIAAGAWANVSFRPNTKVFTSGQATPVLVVLRATDEPMPDAAQPVSGTVAISNVNPNGQALMVGSSPVVLASDQTPLVTATGTKSSVAGAAVSTTLLAANSSRKGATIYNDSTVILYLDLSGGTASSTSYSVQVPAQGYFELPPQPMYTGAITGIWASATGNARITEFS